MANVDDIMQANNPVGKKSLQSEYPFDEVFCPTSPFNSLMSELVLVSVVILFYQIF